MSDVAHFRPGDLFAGYFRIERLLKAGGMGAVYVVRHEKTGKRQALKVMRPEIVADPGARARFEREAHVSSLIDTPKHVVDVQHAGIDDASQMPFIVMELLSGKELGELLLERGRFSPAEVVEWLRQTAKAIDRAHSKGIVHRDLKPENLFLVVHEDDPPTIKILDFGIAKIIESATQKSTNAGGTPLYMSPEQSSAGSNISSATDVWALALIAYTLLVGKPYWQGSNLAQLYREILIDPMEAPSARAARSGVRLPVAFDAWMLRCLERDPTQRTQHAGEAIRGLATALATPLEMAQPPAHAKLEAAPAAPAMPIPSTLVTGPTAPAVTETTGGPITPRRSLLWPSITVAAVVAIGGGVYAYTSTHVQPPPPRPAVIDDEPAIEPTIEPTHAKNVGTESAPSIASITQPTSTIAPSVSKAPTIASAIKSAPTPTTSTFVPPPKVGLVLQKGAGEGMVIPLNGWKNFSVRVMNGGEPVSGARVAWGTPSLGPKTYIGTTDAQGYSSATQLYSSPTPGSFKETAAIVAPGWGGGAWSEGPVPTIGAPVVFNYEQRDD